MKKRVRRKIKKILKVINNSIATISGIISLISLFFDINIIIKYICQSIVIIYLMSIFLYIVTSIFKTNIAKEELDRYYFLKNMNLSIDIHKYFHALRNYISSINLTTVSTERDIMDKCKNICDYLSKFYENLFGNYLDGKSVSVCIKIIKTDSIYDEDYNNWEMQTISRSISTVQKRSNIDGKPVKISDNTDFQVILNDNYQDDLFSFSDMRNIEEDFFKTYKISYKNSRKNYLDFYKSTIVVPIKIDGRFASNELNEFMDNLEDRSLVLGFLCIDSMKFFESKEEKEVFKIGTEYAKAMADSLYLFFEKVLISILRNDKIIEKL